MMTAVSSVTIDPAIIEQSMKPGLEEITLKCAENIAGAAEELLGVYGGGIPSAPGEPPHMQTGKGINSLNVEKTVDGKALVTVYGGEYLAMLDRGTSRVQARPWVAQAIVKGTMRTQAGTR